MTVGLFADLWGTTKSTFQIAIGGVRLKNNAAALEVMGADGVTPAAATVSKLNVTGDVVDINSDAASAGADWKYTIQRPTSGMTAAVTLTLPPNDGSASQVLATDGSGVLTWETAAVTAHAVKCDVTNVAFNTSSPVTMLTLPADSVVHQVEVILDTPFNGTSPTMSVGITGTTSKFMGTTDVNLKGTAKDRYVVNPGETAGADAMIVTLVPDDASAGAIRVNAYHSVPS
jgi:hypothetical protein